MSSFRWTIGVPLVIAAFLMTGCGVPERLVGGRCVDDFDCRERCLTGLPGGFCSVDCVSTDECPGGTICVDTMGGVCLFPCESTAECRDLLGDPYVCGDESDFTDRCVRVCVD